MPRARVFLAALLLLPSIAVADTPPDTIDRYANRLPLRPGEAGQGLYRAVLPLDVYRGIAHGDLRDLRVFNADGERVPFAVVDESMRGVEKQTRLRLPFFPLAAPSAAAVDTRLDVRIQADGKLLSLRTKPAASSALPAATHYLIDASRLAAGDEALHALHLDWRPDVGSASVRVRVETGNDLAQWRSVVVDAPLVDLRHGDERLRQTRIPLPAVRDKYLRLSWDRPAFVLTTVEAETRHVVPQGTPQRLTVTGRSGDQAGEYLFDLGARIAPQALALIPPQANTMAPTRLFAHADPPPPKPGRRSDPAAAWIPVTGATFYRLTRDGSELASPPVEVTGRAPAAREWRALVDTRGGGLGSGMPQLEVIWQPAHIVFAARGRAPFTLAFGRHDVPHAQFQLAALMPGYQAHAEWALPVATVTIPADAANESATTASPAALPIIAPPAPVSAPLDAKKLTLWIVLALGVALLAFFAIRLAKQPQENKDA